jgi:2-polyprenyl-3-methyl-5-hydroxy-6-metoxy-1,4-benzoquinol methylase
MIGMSKMTGDGVSLVSGEAYVPPDFTNVLNPFGLDFPWEDMLSGSTVCDVGSGVGAISLELAKAYPHLNLTLQDQAHVLEQARGVSFLYRFYLSMFRQK